MLMLHRQNTIKKAIIIKGIGLHSGKKVTLKIKPASANTGIIFIRTDLKENNKVIASWKNVSNTTLCTMLTNKHGVSVSTVEHLMAALSANSIDNVILELNQQEVPILDGSSLVFMEKIKEVGIKTCSALRKYIKILKTIEIKEENWHIKLEPSNGRDFAFYLNYNNKVIGSNKFNFSLDNDDFNKIALCRTFCLKEDVDFMQSQGLAKGGSLENAIIVDKNTIVNKEGLRCQNEFAKHKTLDSIGDMYLAGYHILGKLTSVKGGHTSNNLILRKLFADKSNYEIIEFNDSFLNESHYKNQIEQYIV